MDALRSAVAGVTRPWWRKPSMGGGLDTLAEKAWEDSFHAHIDSAVLEEAEAWWHSVTTINVEINSSQTQPKELKLGMHYIDDIMLDAKKFAELAEHIVKQRFADSTEPQAAQQCSEFKPKEQKPSIVSSELRKAKQPFKCKEQKPSIASRQAKVKQPSPVQAEFKCKEQLEQQPFKPKERKPRSSASRQAKVTQPLPVAPSATVTQEEQQPPFVAPSAIVMHTEQQSAIVMHTEQPSATVAQEEQQPPFVAPSAIVMHTAQQSAIVMHKEQKPSNVSSVEQSKQTHVVSLQDPE